uniref:Uncharacterized protein n=1 Tax=Moniliophthora roreri TaxID=221103 RepID=A0A0W0G1N5_MONRR
MASAQDLSILIRTWQRLAWCSKFGQKPKSNFAGGICEELFEFSFINPNFTPYCHSDKTEYEGGIEDDPESIVPTINPNSIKVKITLPVARSSPFPSTSTLKPPPEAGTMSPMPSVTSQGATPTLKIKIPV